MNEKEVYDQGFAYDVLFVKPGIDPRFRVGRVEISGEGQGSVVPAEVQEVSVLQMKSPFPGMDPYLEQHWRDVHASLVVFARGQLQRQLPNDLRARIEERVFLESEDVRHSGFQPDVRIAEYPHPGRGVGSRAAAMSAVAEPLVLGLGDEELTETYIEIIEVTGQRVITSIEFVSPSNKLQGEGRVKYVEKRQQMKASGVNIVEVDLTRKGERGMLVSRMEIPPSHRAAYQACIWRAAKPHQAEIYAFPLAQALPSIRIPLRKSDEDVTLDLQRLVERCYEEGAFDTIDYSEPPEPPLEGREASWARNQIKRSHPNRARTGSKHGLRRHR